MTVTVGTDTAKTRKTLTVGGKSIDYYSIPAAEAAGLGDFSKLPAALKVVLENMLRFEDDGFSVSVDDIKAFSEWATKGGKNPREIAYRPARVLMQDFTGVPAVVDLAAMRDGDTDQNGVEVAYPDTLVGTDSHTTMVNGLAVLGWGVGGIEAEAAMLGQPVSMLIPEVVGFELTGEMMEGTTGTDLVLKVVEMLREMGVVGKFVEFYGEGLDRLPLADRATIANMAPEYGATCGFFPIDNETLRYLRNTGRDEDRIALVEAYAKENGFWRGADYAPVYTATLSLDMGTIVPAISGPKRPQDYVALTNAKSAFAKEMEETFKRPMGKEVAVAGEDYTLESGKVVIASITSCTNTSNPYVMIGAGLEACKKILIRLALTLLVTAAPPASATLARSKKNCQTQLPKAIWWQRPYFPATGTSKAVSRLTCAQITLPRRHWSWLTRWQARWISICLQMRLAKTKTAMTSS